MTRIDGSALKLLERVAGLGEVMALSRNESAVHEKIGVYENIKSGAQAAIVLGENIDLRIFPSRWEHGFAVPRRMATRSASACNISIRPATRCTRCTCARLECRGLSRDRRRAEAGRPVARNSSRLRPSNAADETADVSRDELRDNWSKLTDTHEFFGMLKRLKIGRQAAVRTVGDDYAWKLDNSATAEMMHASVEIRPADHVLRRQ